MSRLDVYRSEEAAASTASGRDAARRDRKLHRFLGGKGEPAGGRDLVLCLTTAPRLPPPHSQPTAYCTHATQPTVPPWTIGRLAARLRTAIVTDVPNAARLLVQRVKGGAKAEEESVDDGSAEGGVEGGVAAEGGIEGEEGPAGDEPLPA